MTWTSEALTPMGSRPAASARARSSPNGDSPSGAGLREKDLFTAKSQHMGFGPSWGTPTNQRAKDVGLFRKMGVSCAAFIGWKHRARVPGFSDRPLTPTPTRRLAPRRYGPRAAK